jgi:cytochrome b subunit of formate dehydrogenase
MTPRIASSRALGSFALGLLLPLLPASGAAAQECADCHDANGEFAGSVHGFLECSDCHAGAAELPHDLESIAADCSICHEEVSARYLQSIHGRDHAEGVVEAPICQTCHGEIHALVPSSDPASPVHPLQLARTCGSCHADPEMVAKFGIPVAWPLQAYEGSVHARVLEQGGATCNDCHDNHYIFAAADPRSTVFHGNVPDTCGQCHAEIAAAYAASVHGSAASHGAREAPVCTDCHGEHRILSPEESGSPVFVTNVPKMTCGRCHRDLRLAEKFGIDAGKVPVYEDSYHGLAARSGVLTVAHCGSCHGVHDTLPSSDPRSHTHKDNLAATCGQCHPGAGKRFAIGAVHVDSTERAHTTVFWVRTIYLWLIWGTVGFMVLHNLLDLRRKALDPTPPPRAADGVGPERMGAGFRIAHALLLTSFAVLVYTGFALKYPEAWWARPLAVASNGIDWRAWLHRGAAIAMLVALGFHFGHLAVSREARRCIAGMRPTHHDWIEFRERVSWFLGHRSTPPQAPTLGYPEKLEYLALMWGLVIMSVTGFLLWFDDLLLRWLPKWISDVATVIHFYEAVLATLAILVWHFYFVIFDPVVYPMDTAWIRGRSHPGRVAERQPAVREEQVPVADEEESKEAAATAAPKTGPRPIDRPPADRGAA